VIGGVMLLFPLKVSKLLLDISQHELDTFHEKAAHRFETMADKIQHASPAAAAYLMFHGLVKAILIYAVFKNKIWGYKGLIGFLSFFAIFETYRGFAKGETVAFVLAAFDAMIVFLIAKEYRARFGSGSKA
jgi:uncharacterized membrane protein